MFPDWRARWLAETLRLHEADEGRQDDARAVAVARTHPGDAEARICVRAREMASTGTWASAVDAAGVRARFAMGVLLVVGLVLGFGSAMAVLGDGGRPVNVVWALGGLLGVHMISLAVWGAGLLIRPTETGSVFGRAWLWLAERMSARGPQVHAWHALFSLHRGQALLRWWLGGVAHALWLALLCGAVIGLLVAFSLRGYGFVWETTILPAAVFEAWVGALGALPALVGVPIPDGEVVRASGGVALVDAEARRAWSAWLLGCVVAYGVLPRALLAVWCFTLLRSGRRRIRLDQGQPGYASLLERLTPASERIGVTDVAPETIATAHLGGLASLAAGAPVLVGVELNGEAPAEGQARAMEWPPTVPDEVHFAGALDTREQRRLFLAALSRAQPVRLLVACDPRLSPDRGTLSLIADLSRHAGECRVWLVAAATATDTERLGYWRDGLRELGLPPGAVFESMPEALEWLAGTPAEGRRHA